MGKEFTSDPAAGQGNPLHGVTFTLDGAEFSCAGDIGIMDISEIQNLALIGADTSDDAAAAVLSQFFGLVLGPDQYARFKRHTRQHRTDGDTIIKILEYIDEQARIFAEAETGRPTVPSPRSQAGLPETGGRIARVMSLQTGDVTILDTTGQQGGSGKRAGSGQRKATAG